MDETAISAPALSRPHLSRDSRFAAGAPVTDLTAFSTFFILKRHLLSTCRYTVAARCSARRPGGIRVNHTALPPNKRLVCVPGTLARHYLRRHAFRLCFTQNASNELRRDFCERGRDAPSWLGGNGIKLHIGNVGDWGVTYINSRGYINERTGAPASDMVTGGLRDKSPYVCIKTLKNISAE